MLTMSPFKKKPTLIISSNVTVKANPWLPCTRFYTFFNQGYVRTQPHSSRVLETMWLHHDSKSYLAEEDKVEKRKLWVCQLNENRTKYGEYSIHI